MINAIYSLYPYKDNEVSCTKKALIGDYSLKPWLVRSTDWFVLYKL